MSFEVFSFSTFIFSNAYIDVGVDKNVITEPKLYIPQAGFSTARPCKTSTTAV